MLDGFEYKNFLFTCKAVGVLQKVTLQKVACRCLILREGLGCSRCYRFYLAIGVVSKAKMFFYCAIYAQ